MSALRTAYDVQDRGSRHRAIETAASIKGNWLSSATSAAKYSRALGTAKLGMKRHVLEV